MGSYFLHQFIPAQQWIPAVGLSMANSSGYHQGRATSNGYQQWGYRWLPAEGATSSGYQQWGYRWLPAEGATSSGYQQWMPAVRLSMATSSGYQQWLPALDTTFNGYHHAMSSGYHQGAQGVLYKHVLDDFNWRALCKARGHQHGWEHVKTTKAAHLHRNKIQDFKMYELNQYMTKYTRVNSNML